MKIKLSVALILFSNICNATNFGLQGTTYPIKEDDLLSVIHRELNFMQKTGKIDELNNQFADSVVRSAERPKPVHGIERAKENLVRRIDPSQVLDTDAVLPNGQVIAKAGSKINPFDRMTLTKHLVFIDGDDKSQVDWAVGYSQIHRTKIILVNGRPFDLSKKNSRQFYFDQGSYLSSKWSIQKVPSVVKQEGRMLVIEEVKI